MGHTHGPSHGRVYVRKGCEWSDGELGVLAIPTERE
jgi:hypothetical protein